MTGSTSAGFCRTSTSFEAEDAEEVCACLERGGGERERKDGVADRGQASSTWGFFFFCLGSQTLTPKPCCLFPSIALPSLPPSLRSMEGNGAAAQSNVLKRRFYRHRRVRMGTASRACAVRRASYHLSSLLSLLLFLRHGATPVPLVLSSRRKRNSASTCRCFFFQEI